MDKPSKINAPVYRSIPVVVERDQTEDAVERYASGYATTFNEFYDIRSIFEGEFRERIAPGAFKKTLKERHDKIKFLYDHGHDATIGTKPIGTHKEVEEDRKGLRYKSRLFEEASYVRDLIPALDAGEFGTSIGFRVVHDEWDYEPERSSANPEGIPERTIKEIKLSEFSLTPFPANPNTEASLRCDTDRVYNELRNKDEDTYNEILRSIKVPHEVTSEPSEETSSSTEEPELHERNEADESPEPTVGHSEIDDTRSEETNSDTSKTDVQGDNMDRITTEERQARLDEIRTRLSEIDTEYAGAAMPESVRNEWNTINTEYDEHERAIAETEERKATLAKRFGKEDVSEARTGSTERIGAPAYVKTDRHTYDVTEIRQSSSSDDQFRRKLSDAARSAVERAHFGMDVNKAQAQEKAESLLRNKDDEQGTLARRVLSTGNPTYERAFGKLLKSQNPMTLTQEEQRSLSLGVDPEGGYAVPFQLDPTIILTNDGVINPLRSLARQVTITGKEWQGVTSEGVVVTRVPESQSSTGSGVTEATATTPTLEQPTVKAERVQGFVPFSIEIDQDWNAMRSEITMMLADAKDTEEAESFMNGDGTGTNAGGLVGTLAQSSDIGDGGGPLSSADIYRLKNGLPPRFRRNAAFLAETSTYDAVRQLDSAGGGDLWVQLADATPGRLIGYRAEEASEMIGEEEAGLGDRYMVFGDFRHFIIVDRVGMSVELVPHLFGGTNRYPTGQRGIFAYWRNNSAVLADNAFRALVRGESQE